MCCLDSGLGSLSAAAAYYTSSDPAWSQLVALVRVQHMGHGSRVLAVSTCALKSLLTVLRPGWLWRTVPVDSLQRLHEPSTGTSTSGALYICQGGLDLSHATLHRLGRVDNLGAYGTC
jgi:hypothetical protein